MSTFNHIPISCEQCGEEFQGTIWTAIHAGQDPELKDLLLGGEINLIMCPECAHVAYQDHFILYQDPAAELIAYVYPAAKEGEAATLKTMMLQGFQEAQKIYATKDRIPYEPILVFGLASLVERLEEEEKRAAESQIAQKICEGNDIPFHLLRPSKARSRGLMRVIPHEKSGSYHSRDSILSGINQLLKINPKLSLYDHLKSEIESNPGWSLEAPATHPGPLK